MSAWLNAVRLSEGCQASLLGNTHRGFTTSLNQKDWKLHGFVKLYDEANISGTPSMKDTEPLSPDLQNLKT